MKTLDVIALLLVIIGGINWGLVGLFNFNLVDAIFGVYSGIGDVIYTLVGLAALWTISILARTATGKAVPVPAARRFERVEERAKETVPPSEPAARR